MTEINEIIKDQYSRGIVIDCLATPSSFNIPWPPRYDPLSPAQIDNVRRSGITAANVTVSDHIGHSFEQTISNIAFWHRETDTHPTDFRIVREHGHLKSSKEDGKLGLILGLQNAEMLGRDLTRLTVLYRLGVRIIQPTYNTRNLMGDGCLERDNAGLSTFGVEAVKHMNDLGIAVDLSHCGAKTTADGITASKKPVIISHSGCCGIYRHPRNKEDKELKAMANSGGVLGIYLMPLLGGSGPPTEELLLKHIEHALNVCGMDHVGIGSDLSISPVEESTEYAKAKEQFLTERKRSGQSAPDEDRPMYIPALNHPRRLEKIALALARRGHSSATVAKVIGGNFYRVFKEIWSAP